jgi:phosphate starvation-inducible protein PhoH and related proteins
MLIPKTIHQGIYLKKLVAMSKPVLITTGPAGCGKTMMACHVASEKLRTNQIDKIVITRPLVSADEELGFLPGKLEKKMEPWIKPMFEIFERERVHKAVEIVPLAYMRGRTFDNSFIIADEMQNSTPNQMKMVLTRIGKNSKMVVTGDPEQSDLDTSKNGLTDILYRIHGRELLYIDLMQLTSADIQRSPALNEILSLFIQ